MNPAGLVIPGKRRKGRRSGRNGELALADSKYLGSTCRADAPDSRSPILQRNMLMVLCRHPVFTFKAVCPVLFRHF